MSDVRPIDANDLKAKIKSRYDNDDDEFDRGYNIGLEAAVDLIDNAPTVHNEYMRGYEAAEREYKRPIGKWIPVSDGLPEFGDEVLTCSNGGFIEKQSLENPYYKHWENQKGAWSDLDEVIAWMPAPEPYQADIRKGEEK